jgi:hypothetical protein
MKKIFTSATVAVFILALMLAGEGNFAQAAEKKTDKGQTVNKAITEKEKETMKRDGELLIRTGKMIEEEGKKTNDKTMIKNGQLMIQEGEKIKKGIMDAVIQ